jgi:hypothetical protein
VNANGGPAESLVGTTGRVTVPSRLAAEVDAYRQTTLAESLGEGNREVIAANVLIANLPALVESAARGLAGANLTVLKKSTRAVSAPGA